MATLAPLPVHADKLDEPAHAPAAAALLFLLATLPSTAWAAECEPLRSIPEAIQSSETSVFRARVIRAFPVDAKHPRQVRVRFLVQRSFKGQPPQVLTVSFDGTGDPRPLAFHDGDIWQLSTHRLAKVAEDGATEGANACSYRQLVQVTR